jgi:transcriptional regulator with XRE-family HTH domain
MLCRPLSFGDYTMTGAEFSALIERCGWSGRGLADRIGLSRGHVGDMMRGRTSPNPTVVRYLERVAKAIENVPPPDLSDRRFRD